MYRVIIVGTILLYVLGCSEDSTFFVEPETAQDVQNAQDSTVQDSTDTDQPEDIDSLDGFDQLYIYDSTWGTGFNIIVPEGWSYKDLGGFDSWVGQIGNEADSFLFDYGWYFSNPGNVSQDTLDTWTEQINGMEASILKSGHDNFYCLVIAGIPLELGPQRHQTVFNFTLYQRNIKVLPEDSILRMFRSFQPD